MRNKTLLSETIAKGFSLIELVVIITIIGVLAITATARFGSSAVFNASGYANELAAAVSYAQRYAVASGCAVQFQITAGGYSLMMENPPCDGVGPVFGTAIQSPGGGAAFAGTKPSGTSVTSGVASYVFNAYGDLTTAGSTVTVTGGGSSASFVIESGSGYVNRP